MIGSEIDCACLVGLRFLQRCGSKFGSSALLNRAKGAGNSGRFECTAFTDSTIEDEGGMFIRNVDNY